MATHHINPTPNSIHHHAHHACHCQPHSSCAAEFLHPEPLAHPYELNGNHHSFPNDAEHVHHLVAGTPECSCCDQHGRPNTPVEVSKARKTQSEQDRKRKEDADKVNQNDQHKEHDSQPPPKGQPAPK